MRSNVESALQEMQSPFLVDDAQGFQAITAQALLKALKNYAQNDRTSDDERIAQGFVSRGDIQNQQEVAKNLKNQTSVDLSEYLRNSPKITERVQAMTTANVQLISSIRSQYLDKVQNAVTQAMVKGSLSKDLAKQIKEIGNVTEKRAMFIARDQSSKLNASLTQARHEEVGITKYMWSTSGDERVRDSHAELDGQVFSYDNPPAVGNPGHDFNCFPGESKLKGLPRPEKFYRRWYSGKLTELVADNGTVLLATPNHPILTDKGIKSINSVNVGDYLVCEIQQAFDAVKLNGKNLIPTIEQVFDSLILNGVGTSISSSESGKFHGDFSNSKIEIISIDSFLIDVLNTLCIKKLPKLGFTDADMVICKALFSTDSHFDFFSQASSSTDSSFMSRFDLLCSLLGSHLTPLELFCFGLGADSCVIGNKVSADNIARNIEMFSNHIFACSALVHGKDFIDWQRNRIMTLVASNLGHCYSSSFESLSESLRIATNDGANFSDAHSFGVEFCRVIDKRVIESSCHIYNLQTVSGYYNIDSVLVSNCRCVAIPQLDLLGEKANQNIDKNQETEQENEKTLPKDFTEAINIGKSIADKYQDVIDKAIANGQPHEGIMEIMRREGVELGGKVDVVSVSKKETPSAVELSESVSRYPKSWVDEANSKGRIFTKEIRDTKTKRARAYHSTYESRFRVPSDFSRYAGGMGLKDGDSLITINMSEKNVVARMSTNVHEYGHKLQRNIPELDQYFVKFWQMRTKGLPIERLRDVTGLNYGGGEICIKDHFPTPYYGKIYREKGQVFPREMLTMTFESLLGGEKRRFMELYEKDPELFNLGLALLTRFKL